MYNNYLSNIQPYYHSDTVHLGFSKQLENHAVNYSHNNSNLN